MMIAIVAKTTMPMITGRSKLLIDLIDLLAEAGQAEDRLGEDRAAEREADVHAEHRHDRQQPLRSTCERMTRDSGAPLARAVRT